MSCLLFHAVTNYDIVLRTARASSAVLYLVCGEQDLETNHVGVFNTY